MIETSDNLMDELVDIIYKKIEDKFSKAINQSNVEFCSEGIVKSFDSKTNTAIVSLSFGDTDSIQNLTGQTTLKVGDKVKIFYNNRSMSGAYIGVKF